MYMYIEYTLLTLLKKGVLVNVLLQFSEKQNTTNVYHFFGLDTYVNEFQEQTGNPAEIPFSHLYHPASIMDPWTAFLYHLLLTITLKKSHRGLQTRHL